MKWGKSLDEDLMCLQRFVRKMQADNGLLMKSMGFEEEVSAIEHILERVKPIALSIESVGLAREPRMGRPCLSVFEQGKCILTAGHSGSCVPPVLPAPENPQWKWEMCSACLDEKHDECLRFAPAHRRCKCARCWSQEGGQPIIKE